MNNSLSRRSFFTAMGTAGLAGAALLTGCGSSSSSSANASASGATAAPTGGKLIVGTLATEDILPLWVAQGAGLYNDVDVEAEVVTFQSATELIAGVASGEVDVAMTDIMVTASMFASGIDVQMRWVTLGATADQGRFGIMVGPTSSVQSLTDLAGVKIGVGSNTILEYVMDRLMEGAGVAPDQILVEEIQKLPVRYQAMASGDVAAAALPGTLLALGEANGCRLVADDTKGDNISQSVMIARASVLSDPSTREQVNLLSSVWDKAVDLINADPESYRETLIENANLSPEIADTYPISTYPKAQMPTSAMVDPVLEWMSAKGYLTQPLKFNETTGKFSAA